MVREGQNRTIPRLMRSRKVPPTRELPQVGDKPPGGRAYAIRNRRQLPSAAAEFVTQLTRPLNRCYRRWREINALRLDLQRWKFGAWDRNGGVSGFRRKKLARIEEKYDRVVGDGEVPVVGWVVPDARF
jgi:hypothetical protein